MTTSPATRAGAAPRRAGTTPGVLAVLAILLALAGAACGSASDGTVRSESSTTSTPSATTSQAPTTSTTVVVGQVALQGRTFWFGDDAGSLFQATLTEAAVNETPDGGSVAITGTAKNLLGAPAAFTSDATLAVAGEDYDLLAQPGDPIDPGASGPIRLLADGVPADASLADATVTFGDAGTNQSIVPLASGSPVTSEAPTLGLVVHPQPTGSLPGGATLTATGSALYPRYGSKRTDQRRLEVAFQLTIPEGGEAKGLFLHPSLTGPDGIRQSIGDQNAFPPGGALLEHAILVDGASGPATITFLEVRTNTSQTFTLDLP